MKFEDKPITFEAKPLIQDPFMMDFLRDKRENYFKELRPEIDDFSYYSKEDREKDKKEIESLKKLWEKDNEEEKFKKDLSSIFEGAIFDLIEANSFLGEGCKVVPASEWDDKKNGVDGIFIFEDNQKIDFLQGIEIDVTFSSNPSNDEVIKNKIESIKSCIRKGILPTLKYFKNPKTGEHQIVSLPKFIIGVQQSSAEGLVRLWGNSSGKNEKLKNHPVQSKIIMELLVQAKFFVDYAKYLLEETKTEKESYREICVKYAQVYNRIYDVYVSKKDLVDSHLDEISSDVTYNQILKATKAV